MSISHSDEGTHRVAARMARAARRKWGYEHPFSAFAAETKQSTNTVGSVGGLNCVNTDMYFAGNWGHSCACLTKLFRSRSSAGVQNGVVRQRADEPWRKAMRKFMLAAMLAFCATGPAFAQ